MKPTLTDTFIYNGNQATAEWFDISSISEMPDLPWKQVYAVGNLDGLVPVVFYADGHFALPGGGTEPGENIEQTVSREVQEEINCKVISWVPLGYQKNSVGGVHDGYQLRVHAVLEKLGDFTSDSGGKVIGYKLIDLSDLSDTIKWGKISDHLQTLVQKLM